MVNVCREGLGFRVAFFDMRQKLRQSRLVVFQLEQFQGDIHFGRGAAAAQKQRQCNAENPKLPSLPIRFRPTPTRARMGANRI